MKPGDAAGDSVEPSLDIREQLARIAKLRAETEKLIVERRLAVPQEIFQGSLATAALVGAVVAVVKSFV